MAALADFVRTGPGTLAPLAWLEECWAARACAPNPPQPPLLQALAGRAAPEGVAARAAAAPPPHPLPLSVGPFSGARFALCGLSAADATAVRTLLEEGGGRVVPPSEKAARADLAVFPPAMAPEAMDVYGAEAPKRVTPFWVRACKRSGVREDADGCILHRPLPHAHLPLPAFNDVTVCVSQYPNEERRLIRALTEVSKGREGKKREEKGRKGTRKKSEPNERRRTHACTAGCAVVCCGVFASIGGRSGAASIARFLDHFG